MDGHNTWNEVAGTSRDGPDLVIVVMTEGETCSWLAAETLISAFYDGLLERRFAQPE